MTDLILSTGTNLGDRLEFLNIAKKKLSESFHFIEESPVYESNAVDYLDQPDFLNQVIHFQIDNQTSPDDVLSRISEIEQSQGRKRFINKGPRTLDIDILFYGFKVINTDQLQIPHPRQFQRSFIITPLKSLRIFNSLQKEFSFSDKFDNDCWLFEQ